MRFPFGSQHSVRSAGHRQSMRRSPERVLVGGAGIGGYCSGPSSYVIALSGVTDALLSRLSVEVDQPFKAGHAWHRIPAGYEASARLERNAIRDPELARYYDKVLLLGRGPLFSAERWRAIWELNFTDLSRYPGTHVDGKPLRLDGPARTFTTSAPALLRELAAVRRLPDPIPERSRLRGVHYRALGQEPGWVLEIGPEWILFEYDYATHRSVFTLPEPFVERGRTIYEGRSRTQQIRITIADKRCRDTMSGEPFPNTVAIHLDERRFHGCGRPLR
jgi:uncharacterized membrane protein